MYYCSVYLCTGALYNNKNNNYSVLCILIGGGRNKVRVVQMLVVRVESLVKYAVGTQSLEQYMHNFY